MNKMAVYLNQHIDGVVHSAPEILERYATDRSILKYMPKYVAIPSDVMDVRKLVKFSSQLAAKGLKMPIVVRGNGYGKNGACLGNGLIISLERLNKIQEIDVRQRLIRVQAGAKLGEVQKTLALQGLELPIYGDQNETIGGLISRNAQASNNTKPSTILDFIDRAEVVLSDGSLTEIGKMSKNKIAKLSKRNIFEAEIYTRITGVVKEGEKILAMSSDAMKSKALYAQASEITTRKDVNLIPLFCGAEGTLGIITEVILRCEPVFDEPNWVAVACSNAKMYLKVKEVLSKVGYTDQFVYDTEIFTDSEKTGKASKFFRKPSKDGFLVVANAKDDSRMKRKVKLNKLKAQLPQAARLIEVNSENRRDFEILDDSLMTYLTSSLRGYRVPILDDVYIPEENQITYFSAIDELGEELKMRLAVFGRPEFNTYTVRPTYIPSSNDGLKKMVLFIQKYLELIKDCGGSCCGGATEGRMMGAFLRAASTNEEKAVADAIKRIFDPYDILNPGTKHQASPSVVFKHLRKEYQNTPQSIR